MKFNGGVAGIDANENGTTSAAQSDYLNGLWVVVRLRQDLAHARGLDGHRRRRHEQLRAGPADVQGARRHRLLPGHPGLVQPLGPARPDAADRVRRPDAARVRPRGGLGRTAATPAASTARPAKFERRRPLLRRRDVHAAQRHQGPAGLPARRPAARSQDDDAPRPARRALGARRERRRDALRRQRRRRLPPAPRRRRPLDHDNWGRGAQHRHEHAAALRRRDGQGRHASTWACRTTARARSTPTARRTRSSAATGSSRAVDPDNSRPSRTRSTPAATSPPRRRRQDLDRHPAAEPRPAPQFSTPFEMDPNDAEPPDDRRPRRRGDDDGRRHDARHWTKVYDLGTQQHPGDASAAPPRRRPRQPALGGRRAVPAGLGRRPTGPKTADFATTGGGTRCPAAADGPDRPARDTFPPGTYEDHAVHDRRRTTATRRCRSRSTGRPTPTTGTCSSTATTATGKLTEVGRSASRRHRQRVRSNVPNPRAGRYVVRVVNFDAAAGTR